jgi:myosin heavy subunit
LLTESCFPGIRGEAFFSILALLSAVLHLGNVQFSQQRVKEQAAEISPESQEVLKWAGNLLGIDTGKFAHRLTFRSISSGGKDHISINLTRLQALTARDSFCKYIYHALFEWLVSCINASLPCHNSAAFIGILDIAGFEIFEDNSFEQLCINYANEKIQQYFNSQILLQEQEIYEREGLRWRRIEYQDNSHIIQLIEARRVGILALLDEECVMPGGKDQTFTDKVHARHADNPFLEKPRVSASAALRISPDAGFIIKHFAGTVLYKTSAFLEKNNGSLHEDLAELLQLSSNDFLRTITSESSEARPAAGGGRPRSMMVKSESTPSVASAPSRSQAGAGSQRFKSVSERFSRQLNLLMDRLRSTQSHFVRCIKPNQRQVPGSFTAPEILMQLRYSGMCAALELLQAGFPTRCSFEDVYMRYKEAFPAGLFSRLSPALFCEAVLVALDLHGGKDFQIGLTKVCVCDGV